MFPEDTSVVLVGKGPLAFIRNTYGSIVSV